MKAERIEISTEEARVLLTRVQTALPDENFRVIQGLVNTYLLLNEAVRKKTTSIKRLLRMIFRARTEKVR